MTLRDLFLRLRALAAPRRVDRDLDEELAFHLEREARKHIGRIECATKRTFDLEAQPLALCRIHGPIRV